MAQAWEDTGSDQPFISGPTGNTDGVVGWYPQQEQPATMTSANKTFRSKVIIQLSDGRVPISVITSFARFPYRFMPNPDLEGFWCIDFDLAQNAEDAPDIRVLWITWSTEIPNALLKNGNPVYSDNPLKRPVQVSRGYYTHRRRMRMTYKKKDQLLPNGLQPTPTIPVVTTAGEELFMELEQQLRMYNCRKNVVSVKKLFDQGEGRYINADTVKFKGNTYKPLTLMACDIEFSSEKFEFGEVYFEMTFKLVVAPDEDGWCEKLRNAGYHEVGLTPFTPSAPGTPTKFPQRYLKAIYVGEPQNPQYPSSPVLLDPDGFAFRAPNTKAGEDNNTPNSKRTGPVLCVQGSIGGGQGITPAQWKAAELPFWPYMAITFASYLPLT